MPDVRELPLVRGIITVPLLGSCPAALEDCVGVASPRVAHMQDGSPDEPAVLLPRHEARLPVVDKEAIAKRPPDVAGVFGELARFAVELAVDDGRPVLGIEAKVWRRAELVVATRAVDGGDAQEHVVQVVARICTFWRPQQDGQRAACRKDDRPRHNVLDV